MPTEEEFARAYNNTIQGLIQDGIITDIDSVESVSELEEVQSCLDSETSTGETLLAVDMVGCPDCVVKSGMFRLEDTVREAYNGLN